MNRKMLLFSICGAVALSVVSWSGAAGAAGEWPCWQGAARDGKSRETGLLKEWPEGGPRLLWKKTDLGDGFSGVAVADKTVYITGAVNNKLKLYAFSLDGKLKWEITHGDSWTKNYPGARSTPTIDSGRLYLLSGKGKLACYDSKTGKEKWSRELKEFGGRPGGWGYAESPLIVDGKVIVSPGSKCGMAALDAASGKTIWESEGNRGGAHYCSAIYVDYKGVPVLINGNGGGIFAVNMKDGKMQWSNSFSANNTANVPTPAHSGDYVFWATGYGKGGICLKLSAAGGKVQAEEAWRTSEMVCHHGGYIIHEGHIYGNHSGGWSCLELKTGKKKWNSPGVGKGSVCFADGMLYTFGQSKGKMGLVECRPDKFEMKGEFSVEGSGPSWAHPVVVGGRLYLRYAGNLYCFDVKK